MITSLLVTYRANIGAARALIEPPTDIAKFVRHEYSIPVNHREMRRGRALIFVSKCEPPNSRHLVANVRPLARRLTD